MRALRVWRCEIGVSLPRVVVLPNPDYQAPNQ